MPRLAASLCFLFACLATPVWADSPLYGELQFGAGGVRHSELDFYPVIGSATIGGFVAPGIGVELHGATGLREGHDEDFDMSVDEAYGVGLRLQSPGEQGTHGYVVLGYTNFTLSQASPRRADMTEEVVDESFSGLRLSIGLMERLRRFPSWLVSAEYRAYYADTSINLDGFLLGLRFETP